MTGYALASAIFAASLAGPALAQNGAMWVDEYGRMMSMQFTGADAPAPQPHERSAAEMAALFKKVCLDTDGDPGRLGPAIVLAQAGLMPEPFTIPGGKKMQPVTLNIWRGRGAVVSQTGGFFASKVAQCNVVFYVDRLLPPAELTAALSQAFGAAPANAAAATKKNGKPNNNFVPEWAAAIGGAPAVVVAHVAKGYSAMPGNRVQIAVKAVRKAK